MKKIVTTFLGVLCAALLLAQSPQAFKYQAVIRNNQGKVLVNQLVSLQISILQDNPMGDVVYMETHQVATNDYGIANITIGNGEVVTGVFADIPWGTNTHFVKTELDITGNRNYEFIGTSQLLSVPYALYAEKAGNAGNALDDFDKDPTNELQVLGLNGNALSLSNGNSIDLSKYLDNTDNQTLTIEGNKLVISGGNSVILSGNVDMDSDPTNELQILSYSNDTIYLSQGNYVVLAHNNDNDSQNELQEITRSGTMITLSQNGGSVSIEDGDFNSSNEIQTLSKEDNIISLSNGGSVSLIDDDTLNEIQTISLNNDILALNRNGGNVDLSCYAHSYVFDSVVNSINSLIYQLALCENGGQTNFYSIEELNNKGLGLDNNLMGGFSVGEDKKIFFSKGCLYKNDLNEYSFREEQYERGNKFESAITVEGWNNLSPEEWEFLIDERPRATDLRSFAKVNDVEGFLILPDDWEKPWGISYVATLSESSQNVYNTSQWIVMQTSGAVFFPSRCTNVANMIPPPNKNQNGYWTSSTSIYYGIGTDGIRKNIETTYPQYIRLVKYVE